jgi:hypothetical protein
MTGKPEVMLRMDSQRRWPEVDFEEITTHLLQARFWIVSGFAYNPPIWTVPSGGTALDLIGAPGSNRDFCSALSCVF